EADHDEPRDGLLPEDLDLAVGVLEQDDEGIAGPLGRVSRPPGDAQGQTPVLASAVEVAEHARHHTPVLSRVDEPPRFAELDPAPVEEPPAPVAETPVEPSPPPAPARRRRAASAPDGFREEDGQLQPTDGPRVPRLPMPSAWAAKGEAPPPPKGRSWVMPLVFGVLGVGLAVGARWYREQQPYAPPAPVPAPLPTTTAPPQMEATPEAVEPARPRAEESPDEEPEQDEPRDLAPAETIELPLTKTEIAKLDAGQGLLEIVAGQKNKILVGGKKVGRGPVVKVPLAARPDPYEVRVQMKGEERVRYVIVKEGVRVRLRVAPPWSR
ncbi:MAG: hypothetical protein KC731_00595, partial [Myxococcales bacterium]|nr:hypothetical protein [Myxococcales bacterium]